MTDSGLVHFRITGEFITQQARTFWAEDDEPTRAIELLESLHGITQQQILDVLEGRAKLTGDSGIGVKLEVDTAKTPTLLSVLSKLRGERDEARSDRDDMFQMYAKDTVIVASPTGARRVPRRQAYLGTRGYHLKDGLEWADADPLTREPNSVAPRIWEEAPELFPVTRYGDPASPPVSPREEPEPPKRPVPTPDTKITSDNGWLSHDGKFYGCRYGGHNQVVDDLDLPHDEVEKNNWVKLQARDDEQHFFPKDYDTVTPVQKELIKTYCVETGKEVPWWINERR